MQENSGKYNGIPNIRILAFLLHFVGQNLEPDFEQDIFFLMIKLIIFLNSRASRVLNMMFFYEKAFFFLEF